MITTTGPRPILVQLAMAGAMIFWGVSFVASKIVLAELSPLTYMGVRFLLASLALTLVMIIRGVPRFSVRRHILVALIALAEPVSYFLFETYGLTMTSATTVSLLIATIPLMVLVFARIFLNEPLSGRGFVAVLISIGGIALLVFGTEQTPALASEGSISAHLVGVLLVFGAVISAATYITLARHVGRTTDSVNLTVVQTWWGAVVFVTLWRLQPASARAVELGVAGWGALLFLVLGATLAAFLLYNWALRHETATRAALYINGIPVVTAITAWVVLDERMTPFQFIGAALVIASVRLATWESRR